jgi:uncharacterized phiE125 gp8 family phage protein
MSSLTLVTAPTEEPVTIDEIKDELRGPTVEHDNLLRGMIVAARKYCETKLKRQFCTATWDYRIDYFPPWEIELPLPPLQSVTSITYLDTGGTSQTWSAGNYLVDIYNDPGRITPSFGNVWPSTRWQNNAVTIRFVSGYGTSIAVPEPIKQAIRTHVRCHYDPTCDMAPFMSAIDSMLSSEVWGCYA